VVVVGNIIAGGAGKTPLTLHLARALSARGRRPLIVTRGYGGDADTPHPVTAGGDAARSGDEAVLLARRAGVPVWQNGAAEAPVGAAPVFRMTLEGRVFHLLDAPERTADAGDLRGLRLHALAGIGEPARFFDHLRALGLDFVAHPFPDHHVYQPQDVAFPDCDALLLTEKDAVKCHGLSSTPIWVLPVEARLDPDLAAFVLGRLAELKHGSTSS